MHLGENTAVRGPFSPKYLLTDVGPTSGPTRHLSHCGARCRRGDGGRAGAIATAAAARCGCFADTRAQRWHCSVRGARVELHRVDRVLEAAVRHAADARAVEPAACARA
jgi:hypothetical protein